MKKILLYTSVFILASCSKKTAAETTTDIDNSPAPYDTAAVDSFAVGADPRILQHKVDSIRQKIHDSINAVKQKEEDAKKALEEKKNKDKNSDSKTPTDSKEPKKP